MEDWDMAEAIAYALNSGEADGWKAEYAGLDEINFTNEHGEKFKVRVEKVEDFDD